MGEFIGVNLRPYVNRVVVVMIGLVILVGMGFLFPQKRIERETKYLSDNTRVLSFLYVALSLTLPFIMIAIQ